MLETADGESVVLHVDEPTTTSTRGDVILAPPFGATAQSMYLFAAVLCSNGFRVIRVDFRNHVGRGTGRMEDVRLSMQVADVAAVGREYPGAIVAAASLSARVMLRALATESIDARAAVLLTPVVDVRCTVEAVTGAPDFYHPTEEFMVVIDHRVRAQPFVHDCVRSGMDDRAGTGVDIASLKTNTRMLCGDRDPWVPIADVYAVVADTPSIEIQTIPATTHRLNRSPALAVRFATELTRGCLDAWGTSEPAVVPPYHALLSGQRS